MLKNIRIILATIALILALLNLFANFSMLLPFVFILLSIMFILFGIDEIKKQQKAKAFVYFLCTAATLYVALSGILP
ncbi:YczI family protein [Bacillus hominis]|uniref:YczI family protein n=1 Tax=Bacillus hominis TaxID=2817478 RepID=A0ABT7REG6_9BACI|nr:YczI family protein [Bacillus hominis]MDM5195830.1 YczI family protein [Bacillus hominis]MDM5435490.1 YczI family protein [Bacillus hominis]MDM5440939.1 YczI family protein [Bacillus hominis]